VQRVALQARRVAKEQPPFREEDTLDLLDRDQQQLASEQACARLEQVRPIDAGEEAEPLDDAPPCRWATPPRNRAAALL
jgi:hypothetical protein